MGGVCFGVPRVPVLISESIYMAEAIGDMAVYIVLLIQRSVHVVYHVLVGDSVRLLLRSM